MVQLSRRVSLQQARSKKRQCHIFLRVEKAFLDSRPCLFRSDDVKEHEAGATRRGDDVRRGAEWHVCALVWRGGDGREGEQEKKASGQ